MSYQCVQAVLRSQLPGHRKLTLIALAEHANKDGSSMWAPIQELASYASKEPRVVIRDLAWLESGGFIESVSGRPTHGPARAPVGGRNRCPRYRLNLAALATYTRVPKPCPVDQGFGVSHVTETLTCSAETLTCSAETLTYRSPDPKDPKDPRSTAAAPPLTHTGNAQKGNLSREPADDGNERVMLKLAHTVMDETGLTRPTDPDLIEALKQRCADEGIRYGPPEVAHGIVERALNRANLQRVKVRLGLDGSGVGGVSK